MATVGAAANIIAIISIVQELVVLARHLKGTMDQVPGNFRRRHALLASTLKSLEHLESLCQGRGSETEPLGLLTAVTSLQLDLQGAVRRCDEIVKPRSRFGKYGDRLNAWASRDDIKAELKSIERQVLHCHQLFIATACGRIEQAVHDSVIELKNDNVGLRKTLDRIEPMLQHFSDVRESSARSSRISSAQNSVGVDDVRREVRGLSVSLPGRTSFAVDDASASFISSASRSSFSHYSRTGDPAPEIEHAVASAACLLRKVREDGISKSQLALNLDELSVSLHDVGMDSESYEMSSWAVRVFTELSYENQDLYGPSLATALYNQASHLVSLGSDMQEAVTAGQRAAQLYRSSFRSGQDALRSRLGMCLNLTANCLRRLGRYEDALAQATAAVESFGILTNHYPVVFNADLGMSLNNLSNVLLDLERPVDAIPSARQAVEIYQNLALSFPDRFKPAFATSLSTYSSCLSDLRRYEKALRVAEKALRIRRTLARDRPGVFRQHLAHSLISVSSIGSSLLRYEAALTSIDEAARVYRDLARRRPKLFNPFLASAFRSKANCLMDMGRFEEARETVDKLLHIYGVLARDDQATFTPRFAAALDMAHTCSNSLGLHATALDAATKAVMARRTLAEAKPDIHNPFLAASLMKLFHSLRKLDRMQEALGTVQEAVSLYRALVLERPEEFRSDLASCQINSSSLFSVLGLHERALTAAQDAVAHCSIANRNPTDESRLGLAMSLMNASGVMCDIGHHREAIEVANGALRIFQKLATLSPGRFASALRTSQEQASACIKHLDFRKHSTSHHSENQ